MARYNQQRLLSSRQPEPGEERLGGVFGSLNELERGNVS